jgi:hypothetical protein
LVLWWIFCIFEVQQMKEQILNIKKNMVYDYYYSKQYEDHMKAILGEEYCDTFIEGKKYTEMTKQGEKPMTAHFPDIKKIHTGSNKNLVVR